MDKEQVYALIEGHYREHHDPTVARIGRYLRHKANAEDVVQEAYYRMCKYWKSYDPEQEVRKWFGTILNNTIKDFFKADLVHGMVGDMPEEDTAPVRVLQRIEIKELIAIIDEKPKNIRTILTLILLQGYTSLETAEQVPESAANVRKIVQRFRQEVAHHGKE